MKYRYLRFPEGKAKAVTLSYDDGSRHDLKFSDIISPYGLKCTFNMTSDENRGSHALTYEQVQEKFLSRGHEIAVHGYMHRAEGTLRPIEGIQDVLNCRLELEKKYDMIIRGMAYPDSGITRFANGASYEGVKQYLKELDIAYARTLAGDNDSFELPTDWYRWMPSVKHKNEQIFEYIDRFLSIDTSTKTYCAARQPRLFYMWGHSHEFAKDDNWDRLIEICERISGKEEIWYATNIEIYNYVTAYNSLIYSADGNTIYNPTLYTLWFDIDGTLYTIKPGETLKVQPTEA